MKLTRPAKKKQGLFPAFDSGWLKMKSRESLSANNLKN
jgi:hypothetical protein